MNAFGFLVELKEPHASDSLFPALNFVSHLHSVHAQC